MPIAVAGSPHEGDPIVVESMDPSRAPALAPHPSLLPVHVPAASSLALNPRTLPNSFHTPPPVHPHLVHHQRIKDKVQQQSKQQAAAAHDAATNDSLAASNPSTSPPAVDVASASSPSSSALAAQILQLQSENAALRTRLRRLEEHNISIPPTIDAQQVASSAREKTIQHQRATSYALSPAPSPPPDSTNHWEEHHAIAAWQHSQALEMPLPLRQNVGQFDAEPLLTEEAAVDASPATIAASSRLHRDVSSLLSHLQPSRRSESRRATVLAFLKLLVRKSLGAQVYPLGAFALKTYLPGGDVLDVSACFSRAHENTWLHRIVNALCQEASANHHNQNNIHATTTTSPHTAVSELSVSFAKQQPYIHACIGGIHVNIFGNAVSGLSSLALFERMDLQCANQHLFKRTVILVKSWALSKNILNFSRSSVTQGDTAVDELTSHAPADGLLSGLFLRTLVLFIFNARASSIRSPLEGLYRLLQYLRDFDWDEHALTLDGPVTVKSLEAHGVGSRERWEFVQRGPTAWPAHTRPFLSAETIAQYSVTPRESNHGKRAEASGAPVSRTASASSLNAASPAFSPNRTHSDASLASLPAGVASAGTGTRAVDVHPSPLSPGLAHSPSYSSLDSESLDQSPALSAANSTGGAGKKTFSMHSQSFSNLQQLSTNQHQLSQSQRARSSLAHTIDSAFSPSHSHDGSVSLTPSHSSVDLQQLMLGINQPTAAGTVGSQSNSRLGFTSGVPTTTLRSSASAAHLHRMPLPVSASSSSFFSSHAADAFESDSDSPDANDDDEPTRGTVRGVHQSVLSSQSLEDEGGMDAGIEGREFWDVGNDDATAQEADATLTAESGSVPAPPSASSRPLSSFVRCSLNVLDPVDSSHNLGIGISYRHEGHIRSVLREGFVDLQHALHKFAFAHAAQQIPDTDESGELDLHPVLRELFEDSILSRYNELRNRESRGKRILAGSPVPAASTVALSASASVGDMASLWSTPVAATPPASNSTPLLFESHSASHLSPARSLSSTAAAFMLNPHSSQFVPAIISGGTATSNIIVDDAAVDPRTQAAVASASAAALASTEAVSVSAGSSSAAAFDSLSGDLDKIVANLSHARQFETPDLSEEQLVQLIVDLLRERSSVPVGRMGSLLHQKTNCHSLPAMLKEQFGGLKNLLQRHPNIFVVGRDHPYNPSCSLRPKHWEHMPHAQAKSQTHVQQSSLQAMMGGSGSLSSSQPVPSAMTVSSSDGGLDSLALTAPASLGDGPNGRRKLQRRRTRTRRTNSGAAAAAASVAAVNAVRAGISSGAPLSLDPRTQLSSPPSLPPSSTPSLRLSSHPSPRPASTAVLALDCEMVGGGPSGLTSLLARVSVVNQHGEVLYDKFVRPSEPVTDYRTAVSGITPAHLESGLDARQAQREVSQLLKSRILVGHGLVSDLQALCLSVPKTHLRDTSLFRLLCPHRPLPLKQLVQEHLGHLPEFARFQLSEHDPVQDARAALALYKIVAHQWETMLAQEAQAGAMHAHHAHSQPNLSTMLHTHTHMQQQQQQQQTSPQREVYAAPSLPPHQQAPQQLQQQAAFNSQQIPAHPQQQQSYQSYVSPSHSPQILYASPPSRPPSHLQSHPLSHPSPSSSPGLSHLLHSSAASSPPTHPSSSSAVHIGAYRQQQPGQSSTQHMHWQQQQQQQQQQLQSHPSPMQQHPHQLSYAPRTQPPSQPQRFHASF